MIVVESNLKMQDWLGSMHRGLKQQEITVWYNSEWFFPSQPCTTRESIDFWSRIWWPLELSRLASCLNGKKTSVANGVRPWTHAAATAILRYNHCTRPSPLIIMSTSGTFASTLPLRLAWRAKHELPPYVPSNHGKASDWNLGKSSSKACRERVQLNLDHVLGLRIRICLVGW